MKKGSSLIGSAQVNIRHTLFTYSQLLSGSHTHTHTQWDAGFGVMYKVTDIGSITVLIFNYSYTTQDFEALLTLTFYRCSVFIYLKVLNTDSVPEGFCQDVFFKFLPVFR